MTKVLFTFRGQSGCRVELIERDGIKRVRKSAAGEIRERLIMQHRKMKQLSHIQSAKIPPLFEVQDDGETFSFEMHYCEMARTFADAAEEMPLLALRDGADFLIRLLEEIGATPPPAGGSLRQAAGGPAFGKANEAKLKDLIREENIRRFGSVKELLEEFLAHPKKYFAPIAELPSGFCHGDLTMDNLLWDGNGNRWMIDPIDCFFEHPWMDVAKLYQDLEGNWYQLRNHVAQRRASSNLWRIGALLKDWVLERWPLYGRYHYYLLGLTFARILPYSLEPQLAAVVSEKSRTFLSQFLEGKTL